MFLLVASCSAESFLHKVSLLADKAPALQRFYVTKTLKQVEAGYVKWLRQSGEGEFIAHLRFSRFGKVLYEHLNQKVPVNAGSFEMVQRIRQEYIQLLRPEFERMKEFTRGYFRNNEVDRKLYDYAAYYVNWYRGLYSDIKTASAKGVVDFQSGEMEIMKSIRSLPVSNSTKEMIRVLVFLEFQMMEYGQ
jgi:hypothetical protein